MPPPSGTETEFIDVAGWALHCRRLGSEYSGSSLVFLHEGLGSVDLWRGFPDALVAGAQRPGFVYSRYGNGWSTELTEPRRPDYMHREALDTLPRIIHELGPLPPVLIGHSDGASIGLIYAGSGHPVEALVLIAPHLFVEPESVRSIASIRGEFPTSDMKEKMAKYHREPKTTFMGWADIWLDPAFRTWDIEEYVRGVRCPTLVIQGDADEYGTIRQLDALDAGLGAPARRLMVPEAGHSPHLSHPEPVIDHIVDFITGIGS